MTTILPIKETGSGAERWNEKRKNIGKYFLQNSTTLFLNMSKRFEERKEEKNNHRKFIIRDE